ncbi:hypothetical protein GCM10020295_25550 [Streptomyces cinereospinus]
MLGVEITGPGFLNIALAGTATTGVVRRILRDGPRYGHGDALAGQVLRLHAPHDVRALVVLDAAARLLRSQGARVRTSCDAAPEPAWAAVLDLHVDTHGVPDGSDGIVHGVPDGSDGIVHVVVRPIPASADPSLSPATPPAGPCSTPPRTTAPASPPTTWSSVRATPSSGSATPTPAPAPSPATPPTSASPPTPPPST